MSNLEELSKAAQDNILNVMKVTQTSVLEAVKAVAGTIERVTPDIPMPAVPLLDTLPNPEQGLALSFDFAEQILQNQRQFAQSLLSALTSAMPTSAVTGQQA